MSSRTPAPLTVAEHNAIRDALLLVAIIRARLPMGRAARRLLNRKFARYRHR